MNDMILDTLEAAREALERNDMPAAARHVDYCKTFIDAELQDEAALDDDHRIEASHGA